MCEDFGVFAYERFFLLFLFLRSGKVQVRFRKWIFVLFMVMQLSFILFMSA